MQSIDWCQLSTRYDRSPATLLNFLTKYRTRFQMFTLTELAGNDKSDMIWKFARRFPEFRVVHLPKPKGADECAYVYNENYLKPFRFSTPLLLENWPRRNAPIYSLEATFNFEKSAYNTVVNASLYHGPAGVEKLTRIDPVFFDVFHKMTGANHRMNRLFVGDTNVSYRRKMVKKFFKEHHPGLTVCWEEFPQGGTLWRRQIDTFMVDNIKSTIKILDAGVLPLHPASDHKARWIELGYK